MNRISLEDFLDMTDMPFTNLCHIIDVLAKRGKLEDGEYDSFTIEEAAMILQEGMNHFHKSNGMSMINTFLMSHKKTKKISVLVKFDRKEVFNDDNPETISHICNLAGKINQYLMCTPGSN